MGRREGGAEEGDEGGGWQGEAGGTELKGWVGEEGQVRVR